MPWPHHLPSYCLSGTNGFAKTSGAASLDLTHQEYFTLRACSFPDGRMSQCPGFTLTPLVTPHLSPLLVPPLFLQPGMWDCSFLSPHSFHGVCSHLVRGLRRLHGDSLLDVPMACAFCYLTDLTHLAWPLPAPRCSPRSLLRPAPSVTFHLHDSEVLLQLSQPKARATVSSSSISSCIYHPTTSHHLCH